ncbi:MAG: hypothetical protein MJ151_01070 [Lachnospiraceae bacterium]|nr:hypothetical protein [Lachnospiraceae bacterium]
MYKKITLDEWVRSGEGGNAISYDHIKDRSVLLKLAKADKRAIEDMKGETDLA